MNGPILHPVKRIDKNKFNATLTRPNSPTRKRNREYFIFELLYWADGEYSMAYPRDEKNVTLWEQYTERVERHSYYLLGLTVASLGYAIHLTSESNYTCEMVFLSGSLGFWLAAIFFGLRFITNGTVYTKYNLMQLKPSQKSEIDDDEELKKFTAYVVTTYQKMKKAAMTQESDFIKLTYFAYSGVFLFIIWRLFELYYYIPKPC